MKPDKPNTKKLMEASYYYPKDVKEAKLTANQRELLATIIRLGPVTAAIIAEVQLTTVVNASQQLRFLSDRKYLTRIEVKNVSGGYMFQYQCDPKKWG